MRDTFNKYDTNRDGVLDSYEVQAMIDDIGYEVDAQYVGGVMGIFGQFDSDGNGSIDIKEFEALWNHLGGAPLAASPAVPSVGAAQRQQQYQHRQVPYRQQQQQQQEEEEHRHHRQVPAPAGAVAAPACVQVPVPVEELARQEERAAVAIQSRVRQRTAQKKARAARKRPVVHPSATKSLSRSSRAKSPLRSERDAEPLNGGANDRTTLSDADRKEIRQAVQRVRQQQAADARSQPLSDVPSQTTKHPREGYPVVVVDELSVHCGKFGRLVSETPSKQFAIVQFEGDLKTFPVKTNSLRAQSGAPLFNSGAAGADIAQRSLTNHQQEQHSWRQQPYHSAAHVVVGDAVEVVDMTSPYYGEVGEVVSTTPSGEFLCVRLSGQVKPRPLRADAVLVLPAGDYA